ncbi:endonuclease domain-containing protein [Arthrobacter sp. NA-172]|uniref:endonuclease domain-containing protein n=1 Tax=Arthrobacter sp. NA-172 TaxID=3367524 RepID=UPI00375407A7
MSELPRGLSKHAFEVEAAVELGVPAKRLRARDLVCPSRGLRVPSGRVQSILDLARPHLSLHEGDFVSHVSSAEIHGVPLPPWAEFRPDDGGPVTAVVEPVPWGPKSGPHFREPGRFLHLSRHRHLSLPRRKGVAGHRLKIRDGDLMELHGVVLTSVARTWVDLATMLPMDDLIVAGDAIVSEHARTFGPPRIAMVTLAELHEFVAKANGVHGVRKARLALERLRVGVDSPPETTLRLVLDDAGLPEFTPNFPVPDVLGKPVWTDLGCPAYRTCLEYEGLHHLSPEQQALDAYRDQRISEAGWRQVKINKLDMKRGPDWVVARVSQALRKQGWFR